jgi:hypothetical protein
LSTLSQQGKAEVIAAYGRRFCLDTLVETGTYRGDMVAACLPHFRRVFSIELGEELAREAGERFKHDGNVTIACGDSGSLLVAVLALMQEPCLIWLDAHYSGGDTALGKFVTPVLDELKAVFALAKPGSVVLIDDARDFCPEKGHPPLAGTLAVIRHRMPGYEAVVEDDIIRVTPVELKHA